MQEHHRGESRFVLWMCGVVSIERFYVAGTWLEHSRISLLKIIWFMWFWMDEMANAKWCKKNLDMCLETYVDFCSYMREICTLQVHDLFREKKIGGPGEFDRGGFAGLFTLTS